MDAAAEAWDALAMPRNLFRPIQLCFFLSALVLFVAGCGGQRPASALSESGAFRVRAAFDVPLNADEGWAGALNEGAIVYADRPFRVRFEVERPVGAAGEGRHRLQYRRNGGEWLPVGAHDFPYPQAELEVDFAELPVGARPDGWTFSGGASTVAVTAAGAERALGVRAGGSEVATGLIALPWESAEIEVAATVRVPAGDPGVALVVGHVDARNYCEVALDTVRGVVRASRWIDGVASGVTERPAALVAGQWLELEVQYRGAELEVNFGGDAVVFTVTFAAPIPHGAVGFRVPAGGTAEIREFALAGQPQSPRVSVVACAALATGMATTDLLDGSARPFSPGLGLSLAARTPVWTGAGVHTEYEWALVARRFADGAETNEEGDTLELRVVEAGTDRPAAARTVSLRFAVPPGHLGGTFVETPGRIGPWQAANGDLYFVMEPAESSNLFMMVKSADGGRTWSEVDGANRPRTNDLEAVDGRLVGDTIHLVHQVTRRSVRHVFRTSDHPTAPDSWAVRDERVGTAHSFAQAASLAVRSDGSMLAFHTGQAQIHLALRSTDGVWADAGVIDTESAGPVAVVAGGDIVHVAYYGLDGRLWHRRVLPDGTRTERQLIASGAGISRSVYGAVLPLVHLPETNEVAVVYRLADGFLWERRAGAGGALTPARRVSDRPVVTNAVDSQQPGADAVAEAGVLHVLFIDEETRSIFSTHDRGGWQPPVRRVGDILGSWVRANAVSRRDGTRVVAFVYDAGSYGGAGMNRYGEYALP